MITVVTIYSLIILYIIGRGFYISRKSLGNVQNRESLQDSISLSALPFYINQGKINLFAFFINFLLISFISLTFLPDLISNPITFCQDEDDILSVNQNHPDFLSPFFRGYHYEHNGLFKKLIDDAYNISNKYHFYIYHLNAPSEYLEIHDYLKVFQGFSKDIKDILNNQNILLQKISHIEEYSFKTFKVQQMYYEISQRSMDTLILTSNAYNSIMDSYNNGNNFSVNYSNELLNKILNNKINENQYPSLNKTIRDFINGNHQINNLNFKITNIFNVLEEVHNVSKENYDILKSPKKIVLIIYLLLKL